MNEALFLVGETPVTVLHAAVCAAATALGLMLALLVAARRAGQARAAEAGAAAERQRELDDKMAEIARANAELTGRMRQMGEQLAQRQSDLGRLMAERLDAVTHRVGQGLQQQTRETTDNLGKLNERLAVIDAAQARLAGLTEQVVGLKDILANKQARGAFGQGRMEAIVRDGLPASFFEFQATLSTGKRPDCAVKLPGDDRVMVIDAKFPLEAFLALKEAADDDARTAAKARVRSDFIRHVKDIADKYFIPGETQDLALLFVPSESVYAELNELFDDVVQRAHKARVIIVSPSLLMMAVQVMQAIVRDARIRDQAHVIQTEVARMMEDVRRLADRVGKLDSHFRQAQEDVAGIVTSADKVQRRGQKIAELELPETQRPAAQAGLFPRAAE
ncbi:MAG: DNA recombination protein RmuC [Methylobacteriaceae bacterium]|nr:DNA recombination protein RmuC [Methylobacteriaceae bacterium]